MRTPTNSTGSALFYDMTDGEIADGIEALTPETRARMVRSVFPGNALPEGTSVAAALISADADFEVVKVPLAPMVAPGEYCAPMANRIGLYRKDKMLELGSAGPNYGIIPTAEAFAAADILVSNGEMALDKIQVIDNGARIRLQGLVGTSHIEQLGNGIDVLAHYATFEACHDGVNSTSAALWTIRLRCFNGMTAKSKANSFSIRHTSKAIDRNREAQAALINIREAAIEEAGIFADLAQRRMSLESFVLFADELLGKVRKPVTDKSTDRLKAKRTREIEELVEFFKHGAGNVGESAYDGFNAITEWVTVRKDAFKDAARFAKKYESTASATGSANKVKATALKILTR